VVTPSAAIRSEMVRNVVLRIAVIQSAMVLNVVLRIAVTRNARVRNVVLRIEVIQSARVRNVAPRIVVPSEVPNAVLQNAATRFVALRFAAIQNETALDEARNVVPDAIHAALISALLAPNAAPRAVVIPAAVQAATPPATLVWQPASPSHGGPRAVLREAETRAPSPALLVVRSVAQAHCAESPLSAAGSVHAFPFLPASLAAPCDPEDLQLAVGLNSQMDLCAARLVQVCYPAAQAARQLRSVESQFLQLV
jgi:hypothetical protein